MRDQTGALGKSAPLVDRGSATVAAMIYDWWMDGRDRSTEAVRGSGSRAALRQAADAEVC